MFAVQQFTGQDVLVLIALVALAVWARMRRNRRRALMTTTERAADDIREELVRIRRKLR
jgi:hypothetical protein